MADQHDGNLPTTPGHEAHYSTVPHLPDPSIFPLILALGMTLLALGTVLGLLVFGAGLVIFAIGLGGWLYEDTQTHLKARDNKH